MSKKWALKQQTGFTIVELLIVIVVIAILAAISIVAYNGIQSRANNVAIISAAQQTAKAIALYVAQEGAYPLIGSGVYSCVTSQTGCVHTDGNIRTADTTFDTNMTKVSSLPRSVPTSGTVAYGVNYNYTASRQYNGQVRPAILMYYLYGQNQNCAMSDIMSDWGTTGSGATPSTTGYTYNHAASNKTVCYVSL